MVSCVILAGGSGTRLWPLSNKKTPKQFLKLFSDNSMIVETSNRVKKICPVESQYVLTGKVFEDIVKKEFNSRINIMAEPMAKNTAPCILWAALRLKEEYGKDTVCVVMPSDHIIKEQSNFEKALDAAIAWAKEGNIVTFGIVPTRPETGYGYIEIENTNFEANASCEKIIKFREKPDKETAKEYMDAGNYLWNAGMFVFKAETMIEEFKKYAPDVYGAFENIDVKNEDDILKAFDKTPSISIDYAIMEHTGLGMCVPASFGWSDVGGYESLHEENEKDEEGNVCKGNIYLESTKGCYINGEKRIVCIGLEDLVVVETKDTIMVARKDMASKIGDIAKKID